MIRLSSNVYAMPHCYTIRRGRVDVTLGPQQFRLFMMLAQAKEPILIHAVVDRLFVGTKEPGNPYRCVYMQRVFANRQLAKIGVKIMTDGMRPVHYSIAYSDAVDGQLEFNFMDSA